MKWKKFKLSEIDQCKEYLTNKNQAIEYVADFFLKDYEEKLYLGYELKNSQGILYLIADLEKLGDGNGMDFKLDFYECETNCQNNEDWWLCLKKKNNRDFIYDDISPRIKSSLEKFFPETCNSFKSKNCICLKTAADPDTLKQLLKFFLDDLKNSSRG